MARTPFPIRERNWLGGPVDVMNPKWVHQNLQLCGQAIPTIAAAFATNDPFAALGYEEDKFTHSIEKWFARPCQIDDSYLISYETFLEPATALYTRTFPPIGPDFEGLRPPVHVAVPQECCAT